MRITVITPTAPSAAFDAMLARMHAADYDPALQIGHTFLENGPPCVDSEVRAAQAAPGVVAAAIAAESAGADGIVINCTCDPGLFAAREAVSIPVIGTGIAAMHTASLIGTRFGFIDVTESSRAFVEGQARRYGLRQAYGAFRSAEVEVLEIESHAGQVTQAVTRACRLAVQESQVDVLILGCGAFTSIAPTISAELRRSGIDVPLIDPLPHALNYCVALVRGGISHSKQAWPRSVR